MPGWDTLARKATLPPTSMLPDHAGPRADRPVSPPHSEADIAWHVADRFRHIADRLARELAEAEARADRAPLCTKAGPPCEPCDYAPGESPPDPSEPGAPGNASEDRYTERARRV